MFCRLYLVWLPKFNVVLNLTTTELRRIHSRIQHHNSNNLSSYHVFFVRLRIYIYKTQTQVYRVMITFDPHTHYISGRNTTHLIIFTSLEFENIKFMNRLNNLISISYYLYKSIVVRKKCIPFSRDVFLSYIG